MRFFLTLKHWQLFSLMILPFLIGFAIIYKTIFSNSLSYIPLILSISIIPMALLWFGWVYSVTIYYHRRLPENIHLNLVAFKLVMIFIAVYITAFSIFFSLLAGGLISGESYFFIMFAGNFLYLFFVVYGFWFSAKTIKSAELGKTAIFSEFAGDFFLMLYPIVGIWILQPRINKLFAQNSISENNI